MSSMQGAYRYASLGESRPRSPRGPETQLFIHGVGRIGDGESESVASSNETNNLTEGHLISKEENNDEADRASHTLHKVSSSPSSPHRIQGSPPSRNAIIFVHGTPSSADDSFETRLQPAGNWNGQDSFKNTLNEFGQPSSTRRNDNISFSSPAPSFVPATIADESYTEQGGSSIQRSARFPPLSQTPTVIPSSVPEEHLFTFSDIAEGDRVVHPQVRSPPSPVHSAHSQTASSSDHQPSSRYGLQEFSILDRQKITEETQTTLSIREWQDSRVLETARPHIRVQKPLYEGKPGLLSASQKIARKRTSDEANLEDEESEIYDITLENFSREHKASTVTEKPHRGVVTTLRRTRAQTAIAASQPATPDDNTLANREGYVFARYKSLYVPAQVIEKYREPVDSSSGKEGDIVCQLKFKNGDEEKEHASDLYRCELAKGDLLQIPGKRKGRYLGTGMVLSVNSWTDEGKVQVLPELRSKNHICTLSADDIAVSLDSICLPIWEQRRVTENGDNISVHKDVTLFSRCKFMVSLSVTDEIGVPISNVEIRNSEERLQRLIEDLGGLFVQIDPLGLFKRTTGGYDGETWTLNTGDLKPIRDLSRFFLITDRTSRTLKYISALALGIPCVDKKWIETGALLPWYPYLLDAGVCGPLEGRRCSQIIPGDWMTCPSPRDNKDLGMGQKPFTGKSILFISSPQSLETDFDKSIDVYVLAQLAILMGATRVEVVRHRNLASLPDSDYHAMFDGDKATDWVFDCAISGSFINPR